MKTSLTWLLLATIAGTHCAAYAQSYPNRPVRIVVPFSPGGGSDLQARTIANGLHEAWSHPVIVDYRPGGTGAVGSGVLLQAPADGYTLILVTSSTHAISPNLYKKPPYHPVRDFTGVAQTSTAPEILAAHPSLPVHSAKELIAFAKKRPGELNYASPGTGSIGHMTGELFKQATGVQMVHVPYKGSGSAVRDLLGGQVELMFSAPGSLIGPIRAGRLRALGVLDDKRSVLFPDLPTLAELGYPQIDASNWFGLLAKSGTPNEIIERLNEAVNKIMQKPDVRKMLLRQGYTVQTGSAAQFTKLVSNEFAKWGKIVSLSKIEIK